MPTERPHEGDSGGVAEASFEMERSIAALALQLPAEVWEDVRDKWHTASNWMEELRLGWKMKAHDLENERLRRIIRNLHPADAPDPLTLRLMRDEVGAYEAGLFCEVVAETDE